jgi:hypothetical protein
MKLPVDTAAAACGYVWHEVRNDNDRETVRLANVTCAVEFFSGCGAGVEPFAGGIAWLEVVLVGRLALAELGVGVTVDVRQ